MKFIFLALLVLVGTGCEGKASPSIPVINLDTNAGILLTTADLDWEKAKPADEFPFDILGLDGKYYPNNLRQIALPKHHGFELATTVEEGGDYYHFTLHVLKSQKETSKGGLTVSPFWGEPWDGGDRKERQLVVYADYTVRIITIEKSDGITKTYTSYYRVSDAGEFQEVRIKE